MDQANEEPRCCFQWEVFNPFLPWRTLETFFFHSTPTICRWTVEFEIIHPSLNPLVFSFDLKFNPQWDSRDEFVADKIVIFIHLNGRRLSARNVPNFRFNHGNDFTYNFQERGVVYPQREPDHLVIKIQIFFSDPRNAVGDGLISDDEDLNSLSKDLEDLFLDQKYSNLTLNSNGATNSYNVHSFLMDERWDKLAKLEPCIDQIITTDIPDILLWDILIYMYSGKVDITWPDWADVAYTAKLFQVIYRYELYHLYKVFVKDDLLQVRVTRTPVLMGFHRYPLIFINGRCSIPWLANLSSEYRFVLNVFVTNGDGEPGLSYFFRSLSVQDVDVRFCVDVIRESDDSVCFVHQRDISIEPLDNVESGRMFFRGFPGIFDDSPEGVESGYYVRCYLSVADGTTVEQLRSIENGDALQSDSDRYEVLSNHMLRLKIKDKSFDPSCVVISDPSYLSNKHTYVHKAIFVGRVPEYWRDLKGVDEDEEFPDIVPCSLSVEAITFVISYVYTGKVSEIPPHLLGEIRRFAVGTKFDSLLRRVDQIEGGRI